jgi:hypothetical protein
MGERYTGIEVVRAEMVGPNERRWLADAEDLREAHDAEHRKAGLDPLPWDQLSPATIRAWVAVAKKAEARWRGTVRS